MIVLAAIMWFAPTVTSVLRLFLVVIFVLLLVLVTTIWLVVLVAASQTMQGEAWTIHRQ